MRLKQKLLAVLLTLCLALVGAFVLHGGKALAVNVDPAGLCVPKFKAGTDSSHSAVDGWLTAEIINRATIKLTYHPNGKCASPSSMDSKFFYQNNGTTFNGLFASISGLPGQLVVVDNDTSDGNFDYRAGVGNNADDTRVDQFGDLGGITDDHNGGHDAQVSVADLTSRLTKSEVTLSFEEDKAGLGCGGNESALTPGSGSNENFVLNGNGKPNWFCFDSQAGGGSINPHTGGIGGTTGLQIGADNYSGLENFNITYNVIGTGTDATVQNVSKGMQKERTFKWCAEAVRPGGGKGLFLNHDCVDSNLVLTKADGTPALPADVNSLGAGSGKFSVRKFENGKIGAAVSNETVAGASSKSAQSAGFQNNQDQGGGTAQAPTGPTSASGNTTQPESCEVKAVGFSLRWLLCPILDAANSAAEQLRVTFEQQLSFTLNDPSNPTRQSATSGVKDEGLKNLKTAWSVIRLIASTLIIIIMLVMVLSEAMDGPLDPYTVRKVLPRLVLAVILMQISWSMYIWLVDRVDDVGRVLANIMYAPFGGPDKLNDLWALMHSAGVGTTTLAVSSWIGLIGLVLAAKFALPVVLLFVFVAIVAIFTGLLVLIFRKIIIIMGLIFMPIALLCWILPGTKSYWDFYRENVTKTLFMFPIVVAIIAAGRIFASIVSTEGNGTLINFLLVMVGFFGPLFILPKTFQWGGSLMKMAGQAAFQGSGKITGKESPVGKYLRNRQGDWNEELRRQSVQRVATGVGFNKKNPISWVRTPMDRFRSGKWDPLKNVPGYGDVGRRSVEGYIQQGEEVYQKDIEAARQKVLREGQKVRAEGGDWDRYFQMVGDGVESYKEMVNGREVTRQIGKRSKLEQTAAMKQTAVLGASMNWRYLEKKFQEMKAAQTSGDTERAVELRKFFDDNVQTIMPKMPHFYSGVAAAADANEGGMQTMHGVEIESILSNLAADINSAPDPNNPDKQANAQRSLVTFLQNYAAAAANENIHLENGGLRAVKAFLDDNAGASFLESINLDPPDEKYGRANIALSASGDPNAPHPPELVPASTLRLSQDNASIVNGLRASLAAKIDPVTGVYAHGTTAGHTGGGGGQPPAGGGTFQPPPGSASTPT